VSDKVLIPDPKAPGAEGVYALDYTSELQPGDLITASAWTLPAGIVQAATAFTPMGTSLTVSGGTDGADYLVANTVTTQAGLTLTGYIMLRVRQPGSQATPVASIYAAQADMVARFGERELVELTDTGDVRTGEINAAILAQALADADATINGYIGSRYQLPLATVPQLLVVIACDIARYRLMSDRPTDEVRQRREDAVSWLDKIAQGKYTLGLDAGNNETPEGDDGPQVVQSGRHLQPGEAKRVFDHHKLHEYLRPPFGGIYY
jgi:phage gp36-like protein